MGKGASSPRNYGLWIHPQANVVLFQIYNQGATVGCGASLGVASDSNWHQLAGTYDGSRIKLYYDGGLVSDVACTLTPAITADPLTIGYANAGAAPFHSPFDGLIDEVKVYNTVHTSGEIAAQYNKEANGPVSLWPAEGNADDLIYGNDGTLENGATATAPGVFGTAFSFDGFDDHVVVPDSLNLNPANGITVEAWVYLTGKQGQNRDIISKDGELTDRQFILTASNLDRFRAHVGVTGGLQFFDGQVPVQLNRWYHVAMTYDGASLKLYVNGELDGSIPVTGPIVSTTEPVRIGGGAPSGRTPLHFPGLIDEAVIFNRALSACEVAVNALVPCDTTPPEITPTVTGDLGNNGWYRSNVTVSWSVTDPESPVTSTSGCGTTILTGDTPGTTLTCTATSAGGTDSDSVTVKIDKTDPLISSSRSVAPNANGWNKTGVTVSYIASDALSGIDPGRQRHWGRRALHGGGGPERYRDSGRRGRKPGVSHRESHQHRPDGPANQPVAKRCAKRQRVE